MTDVIKLARQVGEYINALAASELGDIGFASQIYKAAGAAIYRAPRAERAMEADRPGAPKSWRVRVMLMNPGGETEADSMPEAVPDAQPDAVVSGLYEAGVWARGCVYQYAAERGQPQPVGLDDTAIRRSISSLRVSLSRNAGACWWRLPYTMGGEQWRAMVRIERVES